jgi:hypothetical protein
MKPKMEELNTMEPFPLAFMSGCARRLSSIPAPTFTVIISDNAVADTSNAGIVVVSPTLFT